jgi:hypothetical protein
MGIIKKYLLPTVFLFLSSQLIAQDGSWKRDLVMGTIDVSSRESRSEVARGLLAEIEKIDAYLPALRPEQIAWLEKENSALERLSGDAFYEKISSISRSPESQLQSLKSLLGSMIENLSCAANTSISESRELECWLVSVYEMTNGSIVNDAIIRLRGAGVVSFSERIMTDLGLDYSLENPWGVYNMYARDLIKNLIVPLSRSR